MSTETDLQAELIRVRAELRDEADAHARTVTELRDERAAHAGTRKVLTDKMEEYNQTRARLQKLAQAGYAPPVSTMGQIWERLEQLSAAYCECECDELRAQLDHEQHTNAPDLERLGVTVAQWVEAEEGTPWREVEIAFLARMVAAAEDQGFRIGVRHAD